VKDIRTAPLDDHSEKRLFEFMNHDRVSHFFTIYDLQHFRDESLVWIAFSANRILGYLLEFDKRILCIRGHEDCVIPLLKNSRLTEAVLNIGPCHLSAVKDLYEPVEPADKATKGLITTFLVMTATRDSFRPLLSHRVRELNRENAAELAGLLGIELEPALGYLNGFAYGLFKGKKLVSYAASPEILQDLAIIRGVFTAPEERSKGYSKAVCSALVKRLLDEGKVATLYVSKDNAAAIKVYKRIGFKLTRRRFLGFTAKRRS